MAVTLEAWDERDCCSARADIFCGSRGYVQGAEVLLGRRRRRSVAARGENPAFGCEMLLGCSCSLAAQMPTRLGIELFWIGMKLLSDCGRSALDFVAVEPRVSHNPARLDFARDHKRESHRSCLFFRDYMLFARLKTRAGTESFL